MKILFVNPPPAGSPIPARIPWEIARLIADCDLAGHESQTLDQAPPGSSLDAFRSFYQKDKWDTAVVWGQRNQYNQVAELVGEIRKLTPLTFIYINKFHEPLKDERIYPLAEKLAFEIGYDSDPFDENPPHQPHDPVLGGFPMHQFYLPYGPSPNHASAPNLRYRCNLPLDTGLALKLRVEYAVDYYEIENPAVKELPDFCERWEELNLYKAVKFGLPFRNLTPDELTILTDLVPSLADAGCLQVEIPIEYEAGESWLKHPVSQLQKLIDVSLQRHITPSLTWRLNLPKQDLASVKASVTLLRDLSVKWPIRPSFHQPPTDNPAKYGDEWTSWTDNISALSDLELLGIQNTATVHPPKKMLERQINGVKNISPSESDGIASFHAW